MMFQEGEWPLELIICLLEVLENNFRKVDVAIFQGVQTPFELIFCFLDIEEMTWAKSLKIRFKQAIGHVDS
jgi:hypothetical protein